MERVEKSLNVEIISKLLKRSSTVRISRENEEILIMDPETKFYNYPGKYYYVKSTKGGWDIGYFDGVEAFSSCFRSSDISTLKEALEEVEYIIKETQKTKE